MKRTLFSTSIALLVFLVLGVVIAASPLQQASPDGAHTHPRYETLIAQSINVDATQDARLNALEQRTQVPLTNTPRPTSTQPVPVTPTQEVPGTAIPASSTPTRTPTPQATTDPFYYDGCVPTGDFEAFTGYIIKRRSSREIRTDNIYPEAVTSARIEIVCVESLRTDGAGYTWVQVATSRPEYFAISRDVGGIVEPYGVLTEWGATLSPFTVEGNKIYLDGEIFKFTGVNFRELIGYDNRIMPYANPSDVAIQLDGAKSLGMRVVRFYVSHKSLTVDAAIPRVKNILDMLHARGMYAILVLTDGAYSGFNVADTPQNRAVNGIDRYTHYFFERGFRENYLPYVDALTKAIGAHPAVFAVEPGNEFTTISIPPSQAQMDAFLNFYLEVSAVIRRNMPGKLISSGLESCYQLFVLESYDGGRYCERLYAIVDVGTLHTYQSNNGQVLGSSYMHILREMQIPGVPLIIEETNTFWENESTDWLSALVKFAFSRLSGILHWNMSFPYCRDLGVGDGAWNACAGTAQARRWFNLTGFYRSLSDQLRLIY